MKTVGNFLWHFPLLGFVYATFVYLLGLILTLSVIASPIGLGLMEWGKFLFLPFSHAMVSKSDLSIPQSTSWKTYSGIVRIVYFPFGLLLGCLALWQVFVCCISIVFIPMGLVVAKSLGTCLNPVHKKCVSSAVADEITRRKAQSQIERNAHKFKKTSV